MAQEPQTHTIEITGFKFKSDISKARVGDTIVFVNKDVVPHTATRTPAGWESGSLAKGKFWSLKVDEARPFNYSCRFHPNMKVRFVVE